MKINALAQNIRVTFSSPLKAGKGFSLFNQWVKKAIYGTLTKKEGSNGEYTIKGLSVKDHDNFFVFDVLSSSEENIYWQLENIKNVIKTLPGATSFHAEVLTRGREIFWNSTEPETRLV